MSVADTLLPRLKQNLIIQHNADDGLLTRLVAAAVNYAEEYQQIGEGYYSVNLIPASTEQAIIMLASHFYEARDGSTGGFYADNVQAAQQVWRAANDLLRLNKVWSV